MTLRSPVAAMLWENWRLTRIEAAWRLGLGIVGASAAVLLFEASATLAFWIIVWLNAVIWLSIAKLNGGRFMDGYKPGFPLYLLYTRPVSTAALVGVAVAYDAVSGAVMYSVSAAFVGIVIGQPLPLFSVLAWILLSRIGYACIQWSTPNRVVQWVGSIGFFWPLFFLLHNRVRTPLAIEFSLAENAAMIVLGVVSFVLTVAGVARQRRGDSVATVPQLKARSGDYPEWLVNLFRFPCPTSSATRAQVWFELRSSGLPVLAIGLAMAVMIFLLYAISIAVAPVRNAAVAAPIMFGLPVLLLFLGGNAFGIRKKQGRTYFGAFEATQPYGTAQLAVLKVLVRTACLLAALIAIGMSLWASSSLMNAWGQWLADGKKDALPELLQSRQKLADGIAGVTGYVLAAQAVLISVAVTLLVASLAAFKALWTRYPRRLLVAGLLLLFYVLALLLLAFEARPGRMKEFLMDAILSATGWIAAAAIVVGTLYLAWCALAERLLSPRHAVSIVLVLTVFGAAWLTLLGLGGVSLAEISPAKAVRMLSPVLLLLIFSVLAPWSLSRVRHT